LSSQPHIHASRPTWLGWLVFELDSWLRSYQGVYEYTRHPSCLFRIQRNSAPTDLTLSDGTHIHPGDPILDLHLWNEQMPPLGAEVTLAWARELSRDIQISIRELALYLARNHDLDDIVALRADMRLGTSDRTERLMHLSARYGFERVDERVMEAGFLHQFGENILLFLLLLATNPVSLRKPMFWRDHAVVYLSRRLVEERYGKPTRPSPRRALAEKNACYAPAQQPSATGLASLCGTESGLPDLID
jgi:hypothetical protein